ncbi:zinc finger protein 480-like isoform X2 [Periplaneta americana]|uniref:zinc finger protein 480-like isoform X2 n=1 Tax=Periplaneta americana TaxID=6978 RepID=UPI0037E8A231
MDAFRNYIDVFKLYLRNSESQRIASIGDDGTKFEEDVSHEPVLTTTLSCPVKEEDPLSLGEQLEDAQDEGIEKPSNIEYCENNNLQMTIKCEGGILKSLVPEIKTDNVDRDSLMEESELSFSVVKREVKDEVSDTSEAQEEMKVVRPEEDVSSLEGSSKACSLSSRYSAVIKQGEMDNINTPECSTLGLVVDTAGLHWFKNNTEVYSVNVPQNGEQKPFVCMVCGAQFSHTSVLVDHVETHHVAKPFGCETCGKFFAEKGYLARHERTHTVVKRFTCKVCSRHFSHLSALKNHFRTHSGEKQFRCEVCGKTYSEWSWLYKHLEIHCEICKTCGMKFRNKDKLTDHMKDHRKGENPLKCKTCGNVFQRYPDLLTHLRVHRGDKPFKCGFCGALFSHCNDLREHIKCHSKQRSCSMK